MLGIGNACGKLAPKFPTPAMSMTEQATPNQKRYPALWRSPDSPQKRDVFITLGLSSLVIHDADAFPLSHWSLAAVRQIERRKSRAVYAPDRHGSETLEVEDPELIGRLAKIQARSKAGRPRSGRLRIAVALVIVAAVLALAALFLPMAMARYAVTVVPPEKQAKIGERLLEESRRVTGGHCQSPLAMPALSSLNSRLFRHGGAEIRIVPYGVAKSTSLPGGIILLHRSLIEDHDSAEALAGFALAEKIRLETEPALARLLQSSGMAVTFRLLTTGELDAAAVQTFAERHLNQGPAEVDPQALIAEFGKVSVSSAPYARAIGSPQSAELSRLDPMAGKTPPPVLTLAEWTRLKGICGQLG